MKLSVKAAVGAALVSAGSMSAFATIVVPPANGPAPSPATGNGGLILEVWDTTTGTSLTEWLGPDLGTFGGPATPSAGATLDYGVPGGATGTLWSSLFSSSEITAGDVQFTVSAANYANPAAPIEDATISALGTVTKGAVVNMAAAAATGIGSIFNANTTPPSGCALANPCASPTTTSPGYLVPKFNQTLGGLGSTSSAAGTAGGTGVGFYQFVALASSGNTAHVTPTAFANSDGVAATWTLSASGDLVYSAPAVSAVPLPAAVWLLGSGLLGLAGVARRKTLAA